jgi:hypothetical protein
LPNKRDPTANVKADTRHMKPYTIDLLVEMQPKHCKSPESSEGLQSMEEEG